MSPVLPAWNILTPLREYKWRGRTMNRRKVWLHIHTTAATAACSSTIAATAPARRPGKTDVPDPKKRDREVGASGRGAEGGELIAFSAATLLPQLIFDMNSMGGWWLVSLPALICSLQISSCPYESISVHYVSERTNDVVLIHQTCTDFKPPSLSRSETLHSDHFILRHRRQTITWVSVLLECSEREEIRPRRGRGGWNVFGSDFHLHLRPI